MIDTADERCRAAVTAAADRGSTQVRICTPDKDLSQCVSGTRIVRKIVSRTRAMKRCDCEIRRGAASIPDYFALVGDTSDGYPGLTGWARVSFGGAAKFKHIERIPADWRTWGVIARGGSASVTLEKDRELACCSATSRRCARISRCRLGRSTRMAGPKPAFQAWKRASIGEGR